MVVMRLKDDILKKLAPYLFKHKLKLFYIILTAILANLLSLLAPYLIGLAINALKINMNSKDFNTLQIIIFFLTFCYISSAILSWIQNITMNQISQNIVYEMRKDSFQKLHKFSLNFFDNNSHGNIMSILINDIDNISSSISQVGTQIFASLLTVIIALSMMFFLNPLLTVVQLFLITLAGFFIKNNMKKSKEKMRIQQSYLGKLNGYVEEILLGQIEVKAFSYEKKAIDEFNSLNSIYKTNAIKAYFLGGFNYPTLNFIGNISYSLIIFLGAIFILEGKLTIGALSSFIIYSKMFNRPIANISDFYNVIQTVLVSSERFFSIMDTPDEVDSKTLEIPNKINGELEFKNVSFGYSKNHPVIKDFNLTVPPGSLVAIVGPTGAGKTTLVNLIMRFYDIDSGEILLDKKNITSFSRKDFRKLFGMVLQDSWLFTGTIEENIKYGDESITHEQIILASKIVGIYDFIISLPQGFDTCISEENNLLSQGQKQLITITRAIVTNPRLLILDEATSGVDTRTEQKLQKAMETIIKGRTSFVIAHRLLTIQNADIILVVVDGKIVESGTHSELLENKDFYYKMYNS